jgi:hypothetical protein
MMGTQVIERECLDCRQTGSVNANDGVTAIGKFLSIGWTLQRDHNGDKQLTCPTCSRRRALGLKAKLEKLLTTEEL